MVFFFFPIKKNSENRIKYRYRIDVYNNYKAKSWLSKKIISLYHSKKNRLLDFKTCKTSHVVCIQRDFGGVSLFVLMSVNFNLI